MGLLDFLGTKPASNTQGGLVVSPSPATQSSSTQTDPTALVQKSYKDLQYPMPAANSNQLGSTVLPQADLVQPKLTYPTESLPAVVTPVADAPATHVETVLDNGVRQITHAADNVPVETPIIPVESNTPQPLYSYSNNPIPADALVEQVPQANTVENQTTVQPELPPIDNNPVNNSLDTTKIIENPIESNVPGVTVSAPSAQVQSTVLSADEGNNGDIIEIGSAAENPVSSESQLNVNTPVVEETQAVNEPIIEQTSPLEAPTAVEPSQPADITEKVEEPAAPAEVLPTEVKPEVLETTPVITDNKQESTSDSLKVLNKIAFVSLNTQSVNSSLSQKVKSLAEMLKSMNTEIFIDSNKGYGMDLISGLSGTTGKVTAAYLKPFFSKYSDETTLEVPITNLTRITFSTVLDRIKFLYKEATVFILPETSGLNSLSQALILLNSQAMYFGSHKPVILFGTAWKEKIDSLKNSFGLTQQEIDSMNFASTPDEVIVLLKKLDAQFSEKNIAKGSTIDMRDEQGEKEGLLTA